MASHPLNNQGNTIKFFILENLVAFSSQFTNCHLLLYFLLHRFAAKLASFEENVKFTGLCSEISFADLGEFVKDIKEKYGLK